MGNIFRKKLQTRPAYVKCTVIIASSAEIAEKNRPTEDEIDTQVHFKKNHFVSSPESQSQFLDISAPAGRIILQIDENHQDEEEFLWDYDFQPTPEAIMGETKRNSCPSPRKVLDWSTTWAYRSDPYY